MLWIAAPRPPVNVFSITHAAYLMPFFMLGYICARKDLLHRLQHRATRKIAAAALLCLIAIGFALASGLLHLPDPMLRRAATFAIGASFCMALLVLAPRHAGLAQLGGYSYTIYLFHVFFTAAASMALQSAVPQAPVALVWMAGLLIGLLGPIALHTLVVRHGWLRVVLLGLRPTAVSDRRTVVAHSQQHQRA